MEVALFFMRALEGMEDEFEYSLVGHSGNGPEAERLIEWAAPPTVPTTRAAPKRSIARPCAPLVLRLREIASEEARVTGMLQFPAFSVF